MSESDANTKNSRNSNRVQPHKHCRICQEAIPSKTEPRVCKQEECATKNEKNEKNENSQNSQNSQNLQTGLYL